jgi:hypothetical protein
MASGLRNSRHAAKSVQEGRMIMHSDASIKVGCWLEIDEVR